MRFLKRLAYFGGGLVVLALVALWMALRASLPQLDGRLAVNGVAAPVTVTRDALGVVTIDARDRRDAAFATGFVHAQERLFQMDLMRRLAAGELAALVGEAAVEHDLAQRLHRLRSVARRVVADADAGERALVEAYAAGVNAGLEALAVRPFEYLLLRARPVPWLAEDTVLVVMAMYFRLHDERGEREARLARLRGVLAPEMFAFVTQLGTHWDAPLVGEAVSRVPVPGPEVCDVGRVEQGPLAPAPGTPAPVLGSNAWAVAPARTRDGVAMVANDLHLGLALPNTWFRLRLRVADSRRPGADVNVAGVTLPGTPAVVVGSNGHVAWALTNTYGDWVDLVELELDPEDPERYRTPDGYRPFRRHRETVRVHGAASREREVRTTVWGPVPEDPDGGPPRALRWLAHEAEATNLALLELEGARDVAEAMAVAARSGIPPQNFLLADSAGDIAWTVAGRLPRRRGYEPGLPASWADGDKGWFGFVAPDEYPRIVNPPAGALWSANARTVDGDALALIGDGGYALGARATQIRDALLDLEDATEADMLRLQLDDRARFLAPWRSLLLAVLDTQENSADPGEGTKLLDTHRKDTLRRRAAMRRLVAQGARRAAVDDAGYRLVRAFRDQVAEGVLAAILRGCGGIEPRGFGSHLRQWEGPLWQILEARPAHLLAPGYPDWDAFLLAAADAAAAGCGEETLAGCTWGDVNTVRIRHPMSMALPVLSAWLDMPPQALPGDTDMPRVQAPYMGASLRFAVSPGREASGYLHMPGGQSGHPLSPFYDAGHRAWAEGEATPLLPGPERHRLVLEPRG